MAQWLERRTPDPKVSGSSPGRRGGRMFFSRVNFLCLLLFLCQPPYFCVRPQKPSGLLGTGRRGEVGRWREREIIYLSLHYHHQNDSCIEMGSDESHFNVSLIVRDKFRRQCPQTTTFEEKAEPKRSRTEVPLLTSLTPYH